jgi:DNA-binding SARP family transcriptional activator
MQLSIRILGKSRVEEDGHTVSIPSGKTRELFAYLVMHPHRMHHREFLAEILFPEMDPRPARRHLCDKIYRLRQAIGADWFAADVEYVALDERGLWVDAWEFSRTDDPARAIELYSGDLLEDLDATWLLADRARFRNRALILLEKHYTTLVAGGRIPAALELAHRWIDIEPLSEQAHCAAIRLYAQLGHFDPALNQYHRLTQLLSDELGISPSPSIQALRDTLESEREAMSVKAQSSIFVGRRSERARLAQLANAAMEGHGTIVLIEGASGVGKTRLLETFAESAAWRGFAVSWTRADSDQGSAAGLHLTGTTPGRPLAVVVDDVHSAPERVIDDIVKLAPSIPRLPLVLMLSGRSNGIRRNPTCWQALRRLEDQAALEHCVLGGLSVQECVCLAHAIGSAYPSGKIRLLHQHTNGHPAMFLDALRCNGRTLSANRNRAGDRFATVKLTRTDVPLGRTITAADRVAVEWTLNDALEDDRVLREHGPAALRRHRLRRLVAEARAQGAAPTQVELAQALGFSVRTIARDFTATGSAGTRRLR